MSQRRAYLTLVEVGRLMGLAGKARNVARQALGRIRAKEAKLKKPILTPRVGVNGGIRYMVARWTLQKRMPELFPRRDEIGQRFNEELEDVRSTLDEHFNLIQHLGEVAAELRKEIADLRAERANERNPAA